MSWVDVLKCDGCAREMRQVRTWSKANLPNGWWLVEGVYGGGEPYDGFHVCSLECMVLFAERQRTRVLTTTEPF